MLETAEESALPRQRRLFEVHGIDLDFTSGALRAVAEEACALGTGARGLNRAVLRSLAEVDYRLPELAAEGVTRVTVTAASVRNGKSVDFQRSRSRPRAVRRPGARAGRPEVPGDAAQPACRTVAEDLRAVALAVPESSPQEATGSGSSDAFTFTDARELTPQQIRKRLDAVKKSLKFGKSMLTARKWWSTFEDANRGRLPWCCARPRSCACATAGWTSSSTPTWTRTATTSTACCCTWTSGAAGTSGRGSGRRRRNRLIGQPTGVRRV
ncbi:MAG: hypothetical protein IPH48_18215 [bacterium]|nr:hypothetical protein [bacterium]